jgi:hypothetical protein
VGKKQRRRLLEALMSHPNLDAMSKEELEKLYEETEVEIKYIKEKDEGMRGLLKTIMSSRERLKPFSESLPIAPHVLEKIRDMEKLLKAIKVRLKYLAESKPEVDQGLEILKQIKQLKEDKARLLEGETDQERREDIELLYRKKIDKLREKL